jgi:hypothetical protein
MLSGERKREAESVHLAARASVQALGLGSDKGKYGWVVPPIVGTKKMAATEEGGHFDLVVCGR